MNKLQAQLTLLFLLLPAVVFAQVDGRQYFRLAKAKYDQKDYSQALEYINQSVEADSSFLNAFLLRAQIYEAQRKYAKGIKDYTFIIDQIGNNSSQSFSYLFERAILSRKRKDFKTALKDIDQAIMLNPTYAKAHAEKAYILFMERKPKIEALQVLDDAIELDPNNPDFYQKRAYFNATTLDLRLGEPDLSAAIVDINKAIELSPRNNELYAFRRKLYQQSNQDDLAIQDLTRSISWGDYDETQLFDRGKLFMKSGKADLAIKDFNAAIKKNDQKGQFYRYLGLALHNQAKYQEAIDMFTSAINRFEGQIDTVDRQNNHDLYYRLTQLYAQAYIERGMSRIQLNHNNEACFDFRQALKYNEKIANRYLNQYCEP
ncbi:tetratricopeptide repeat protein [Persicobacter psychrovividus]|uniref:Tetratricopeptide repeat protein n=1 Tax=Persicobacter psychrovividus TaxID=387638 RepID=A0ABM7VFD1_9BACT|nr:hypothetical protein PEPS_19370 [Persicobacter psychrovividus]